jgi:methyl acetate hydrolase
VIIARIAGMTKPKSAVAAAVLALALAGSLDRVPRAAAPPAIPAAGRSAIASLIRRSVADRAVPAVTVVVVNRDQQLLLDAAGRRDAQSRTDLTSDAIFRIASMTKPITSLATMMLVEEGKISLDDPISKYLPEFERVRVLTSFNDADATFQSRPPARPILIRHLLTNTSGIGYSFSDSRLARLDDGKKREVDMPLLHDPGARFTYGPNTAVLGYVIEKISGQTLDVFLKARIFDPIGMRDTSYLVPPEKKGRVVTVHVRTDGNLVERPNAETIRSNVRGDGGLFSTAADYGRFMQMVLNGGRAGATRLVSEATLQLMTSNQIGDLTVVEQPSANAQISRPFPFGSGRDKFGFGFQIETAPARAADRRDGLRSAGSLSWGGINNTHFWIDPTQQIGAAVLMQLLPYYDESAIRVLRGVEELVYRYLQVQS